MSVLPGEKLLHLADVASATYKVNTPEDLRGRGYLVYESPSGFFRAIKKSAGREIYVGIRGTEGGDVSPFFKYLMEGDAKKAIQNFDGIMNWITNFSIFPLVSLADDFASTEEPPKPDALVHPGFMNGAKICMDMLRASIVEDIETDLESPVTVHVVGHSLGGAIATVVSLAIQKLLNFYNNNSVAYLTTFGAPRVGNVSFGIYINQFLSSRITRVVNDFDLVPYSPTSIDLLSVEFCHICPPYNVQPTASRFSGILSIATEFLEHGLDPKAVSNVAASALECHAMTTYCAFLKLSRVDGVVYSVIQTVRMVTKTQQILSKFKQPNPVTTAKEVIAAKSSVGNVLGMTAGALDIANAVIGAVNLGVNIHNAVMLHRIAGSLERHHGQVMESFGEINTAIGQCQSALMEVDCNVKEMQISVQDLARGQDLLNAAVNRIEQRLLQQQRDQFSTELGIIAYFHQQVSAIVDGEEASLRPLLDLYTSQDALLNGKRIQIDDRLTRNARNDGWEQELYYLFFIAFQLLKVKFSCMAKCLVRSHTMESMFASSTATYYRDFGSLFGHFIVLLRTNGSSLTIRGEVPGIAMLHLQFLEAMTIPHSTEKMIAHQLRNEELNFAINCLRKTPRLDKEAMNACYRAVAVSPDNNFGAFYVLKILGMHAVGDIAGACLEGIQLFKHVATSLTSGPGFFDICNLYCQHEGYILVMNLLDFLQMNLVNISATSDVFSCTDIGSSVQVLVEAALQHLDISEETTLGLLVLTLRFLKAFRGRNTVWLSEAVAKTAKLIADKLFVTTPSSSPRFVLKSADYDIISRQLTEVWESWVKLVMERVSDVALMSLIAPALVATFSLPLLSDTVRSSLFLNHGAWSAFDQLNLAVLILKYQSLYTEFVIPAMMDIVKLCAVSKNSSENCQFLIADALVLPLLWDFVVVQALEAKSFANQLIALDLFVVFTGFLRLKTATASECAVFLRGKIAIQVMLQLLTVVPMGLIELESHYVEFASGESRMASRSLAVLVKFVPAYDRWVPQLNCANVVSDRMLRRQLLQQLFLFAEYYPPRATQHNVDVKAVMDQVYHQVCHQSGLLEFVQDDFRAFGSVVRCCT